MDEKCCLLKWQPIVDVDQVLYNVYMETSISDGIELIVEGLTEAEFLTGALRYDCEYKFYVTSVNSTGNESEKSAPITFKLSQADSILASPVKMFELDSYFVDTAPLIIGLEFMSKNMRLKFRGDEKMDVKYLFGSEDDYVQYERPGTGTLLVGRYVRDGMVLIEKSVDIEPILSLDTGEMPFVEISKHGNTWDFHVSNKDADGNPARKTLSMYLDDSYHATEVRFNNDTTTNYMLIDMLSHELSVYDSPLKIVSRDFSKPDFVSGKSIVTSLTPVIKDGGLQIGSEASLHVNLNPEGISLDQVTYISWKFKKLATAADQVLMEYKLGANTITYNKHELYINGVYVCDWVNITPEYPFVIMVDPTSNDAKLIVRGRSYDCEFYSTTKIDQLHIGMNTTAGEFILENFVMQSSENYFLDSIPPDVVTHINAKTGNREIFLDWKASESKDISGYNVYVNGFVHNLSLVTQNNYQITGLENSLEYLVTVTAVDKSGNESVSAEALKLMTLADPTYEISALTIDTSEAGVQFKFTPPTYPGVDKIRIYRESMSNLGVQLIAELPYNASEYLDEPKPTVGKYMYLITTVGLSGTETNGTKVYYNVR